MNAIKNLALSFFLVFWIFPFFLTSVEWTTQTLSNPDLFSHNPVVAVNDQKTAIAVWYNDDNRQIEARIFSSSSWAEDIIVLGDCVTGAEPKIALTNQGEALVVWVASDGTTNQVVYSKYSADLWSSPAFLTTGGNHKESPVIATNQQGSPTIASVVWLQTGGSGGNDLYGAAYNFTTSQWSSSSLIHLGEGFGGDNRPTVVMQWGGTKSFAGWLANSDAYSAIKASLNENPFTTSWNTSDVVALSDPPFNQSRGPSLAMDRSGRAVAIWDRSGGAVTNTFDPTMGWAGEETLTNIGSASNASPKVALTSTGDLGAGVWIVGNSSSATLHFATFDFDTGWSNSEAISNTGVTLYTTVAMDDKQNIIAAWSRSGSIEIKG